MKKNIEGVGEVSAPSSPKEKIQNFLYHYKWHSVIAILLIIAIIVCALQFCQREKYDAYIFYAGSHNIGRTASDGDVAEIAKVISSIKRITEDFDGDGSVSPSFTNYFYLSGEEAKDQSDVNEALLANDRKSLTNILEHSDYYLTFISRAVYEEYHKVGDEDRFISLEELCAEYPDTVMYSHDAILLSSTSFYSYPGISSLPADTLICIRRPSVLGGKSKEHTAYLENAKEMLRNILEL